MYKANVKILLIWYLSIYLLQYFIWDAQFMISFSKAAAPCCAPEPPDDGGLLLLGTLREVRLLLLPHRRGHRQGLLGLEKEMVAIHHAQYNYHICTYEHYTVYIYRYHTYTSHISNTIKNLVDAFIPDGRLLTLCLGRLDLRSELIRFLDLASLDRCHEIHMNYR